MLNSVVLIGRLVADPGLKYTPSGVAVSEFRIAVDRKFKSEGGEKQTDFIDIVAWRQSAEFCANYLSKGRLIAVQGRIETQSWEKDGQKRSKTQVVADSVQGLDKPKDGGAAKGKQQDSSEDYDPFAEE